MMLQMYQKTWSVKHRIDVKFSKKREISNATEGTKDVVSGKSEFDQLQQQC